MNFVEILIEKNLTISSAESFTGGGFSNFVTNMSHSSKVFLGGIVSYSPQVKKHILGVNKEIIDKYGTISKECCKEMVCKCKELFNSDIAVSFTGNAGPTASEEKPVGLIYIGINYKDNILINEYRLEGDRESIKKQAIEIAINKILEII